MSVLSEEAIAGLPVRQPAGPAAVKVGLRYRADIDGLRAIAVLPVVFYHYRVAPFTGGFVGVDVFFVISGYLITGLIWGEMQQGTFSVLRFYERRIRRIFPALFAMLAIVSAASGFILFPHMLMRYGVSVLAAAGFLSNFHFWGDTNYWAAAAIEKPLLHTWSLAVEEQFYVIFPGFLLLLQNQPVQRLLIFVGLVLAISLILSIVGVHFWPITTFYMLPMRFWELLAGAMLALGNFRAPENPFARNLLSLIGLALIGWSIATLTTRSLFPGVNAIPPCLGAALFIYAGAGERTVASDLLSMKAPVLVGLISYSLYLWHWPIFVLASATQHEGLTAAQTILCIAASFLLAIVSWRYVERPFRGRASPIGRKMLFATAGAAVAASALVGLGFSATKGLPQRYDPATRVIVEAMDQKEPLRGRCFDLSASAVASRGLCKFGAANVPVSFLLWGDSHADAMVPAIMRAAQRDGKAGLLGAHGHCAPLYGVTFPDPKCRPFNNAVMKIAMAKGIHTVLLDAKWASPAGEPSLQGERTGWNSDDESRIETGPGETRKVFARSFARTVKMLRDAGKRVIIVGPVPEFRHSVPDDLASMRIWGGHWDIAPTRARFLAREAYAYSVFGAAAKTYGATVIYLDPVLCPGHTCRTMENGRPLYRDSTHLSVSGARSLAPLFQRRL